MGWWQWRCRCARGTCLLPETNIRPRRLERVHRTKRPNHGQQAPDKAFKTKPAGTRLSIVSAWRLGREVRDQGHPRGPGP